MSRPSHHIPVIDLSAESDEVLAQRLDAACRDRGFFVVTGHGVRSELLADLEAVARAFFALDPEVKSEIAMDDGGKAWRGWFALGSELTAGRPDHKEGIYFGSELPADDPRPLHGPNLFPSHPAEMRDVVLEYIEAVAALGRRIVALLDRGLGLDGGLVSLVDDPTVLFRIFAYPPAVADGVEGWGVAEHSDYGLITLLLQDHIGGLQVASDDGWIDVEPIAGSFVCNIGDMLERATGGTYRSTPHRVRNVSSQLRLSFPLFFDPGWSVRVTRLIASEGAGRRRWDREDPLLFEGTYGEYLMSRVRRVFPQLGEAYLDERL